MNSQIISKGKPKVTINEKGDTLISFHASDAKLILSELLDKEVVDSLLIAYQESSLTKDTIIYIQKSQLSLYQQGSDNRDKQIVILNKIIFNKDEEIGLLNSTIKIQKKEIKKQKFKKMLGFVVALILPITILILK